MTLSQTPKLQWIVGISTERRRGAEVREKTIDFCVSALIYSDCRIEYCHPGSGRSCQPKISFTFSRIFF